MDETLRDKYIAMIKNTFNGKFDEFEFKKGSNDFTFKQKIPRFSNDKEQYYLRINVGRYITFHAVRETMYHGKQISETQHHRCTKSVKFHNENKLQIEWFKEFIDKKNTINIDINNSKNAIVEEIIKEKYGIDTDFGYYGNKTQIRLNDKYRENVINGAKIQQLFAEIKKEFELFDVMKKI